MSKKKQLRAKETPTQRLARQFSAMLPLLRELAALTVEFRLPPVLVARLYYAAVRGQKRGEVAR